MFIAKKYSTFNEFIFFSEYSVLLKVVCLYIKLLTDSSFNLLIKASKECIDMLILTKAQCSAQTSVADPGGGGGRIGRGPPFFGRFFFFFGRFFFFSGAASRNLDSRPPFSQILDLDLDLVRSWAKTKVVCMFVCTCYVVCMYVYMYVQCMYVLGVQKNFCYFSSLITFYYIHES